MEDLADSTSLGSGPFGEAHPRCFGRPGEEKKQGRDGKGTHEFWSIYHKEDTRLLFGWVSVDLAVGQN